MAEQLAFPEMTAEDEFSAYHDTSKYGYFSILHDTGRLNSKGYPIKKQESYLLRDMPLVLDSWKGTSNTWISQAEFKKPNRRAVNMLRVGLAFIDLDFYKVDELRGKPPEKVQEEVFLRCFERGIPAPNLIVASGRGLQLKWVFTHTLPNRALIRWNRLQSELVSVFSDMGADPAARDISRVLRLVDTYHATARTVVKVTHNDKQWFSFDSICDQVLPYTRAEIAQMRESSNVRRAGQIEALSGGRDRSGLKSFSGRQLAWDRFNDLRLLVKLRGGAVPEGERMVTLFWQLNFMLLSGAANPNELYLEAHQIARQIAPDWQLPAGDLSTLYRKGIDYINGKTVTLNGQDWPALYTPKNQTLIDLFRITSDEEKKLRTIISKKESQERHRKRNRRSDTPMTRAEYERNSAAQNKPWEQMGMSRRTWYRRGKPDPGLGGTGAAYY